MKLWLYALFMAWGMFLSLPCPLPKWNESARVRMLACMPFIGLVIGVIWALSAYFLARIDCPKPILAFVLSMLPFLLSGFLHLDGFSDVCDAILSRRDLETRLKILKDPHIGAFGVICIALLLIAQYSLFLSMEMPKLSFGALLPLALIPVSTRACAAIAVTLLQPIKNSQYAGMERESAKKFLVLPAIALAFTIVGSLALSKMHGIAPLAAALFYCLLALRGYRNLEGMNGDISGYALTIGELFGIAAFVLIK